MTSGTYLDYLADDLVSAAAAVDHAAATPGASGSLGSFASGLEETLQLFSASLYKLADDAVPALVERRRLSPSVRAVPASGLSREQEVKVVSTLHDLAAALSRCARSCREVGEGVAPPIARSSGSDTPLERAPR